ncbi:hypothetical protein [Curvibacter delicatus]|jgi:hypothetical protein|uniref:hypothetical protein n=1 Tax=Curvibacter delicatus TaxID=80879 RepID=UPI0008308165|nr:hypothetical protein [Curvibacter delicatus]
MNTGFHTLAGRLRLHPRRVLGSNLQSTRQALARRVAAGCPAEALPARLASLFNLCGQAHRLCSSLALGELAPELSPLFQTNSETVRDRLETETLCEHVRRIGLDWPRAASGSHGEHLLATLAGCPLLDPAFTRRRHGEAALAWLEERWLGMRATAWLHEWEHDGGEALTRWAQGDRTPLAGLLQALRTFDSAPVPAAVPPLYPPVDEVDARLWLARVQACADYTGLPQQEGRPCHTGSWSRVNMSAIPGASTPWVLLGCRLAETVRLCLGQESEAAVLAWGAHALPDGWALGWAEMARGVLVHLVRLRGGETGQVVERCEVVAPTEWNFHPRGVAAQALATIAEEGGQEMPGRIALMMTALDPCVDYDIEWSVDNGGMMSDKEPRVEGGAHA